MRQRDHVEIPFYDHYPVRFADAVLGLVETIERRAFMKQRRLARIEILGQSLIEHAPAEGDDFTGGADDRKNHTREKFFVELLSVALPDEAQTAGVLGGDIFLAEYLQETGAGLRRVTQQEFLHRRLIDAPPL